MKIVQIVPYDPSDAGSSGVMLFLKRLIRDLTKKQVKVKLLGIQYNNKKTKNNFEFIPICTINTKKLAAYRYFFSLIIKGKKYIKKEEIIHTHKVEFLIPFLKLANPKIITIHVNIYREIVFRKNWLVAKAYQICENHILKNYKKNNIKRVVFVDSETRKDYISRHPYIEQISEVMPVGIDTEKYTNAKTGYKIKIGLTKKDKIIVSIGRLVKEKDLSLVLESFKIIQNKNFHLIIIGDGPDRERLEALSKKLKLKNYTFLGNIPNDQIAPILKSSNIFVMSSLYEGTPTTILEALASGIPVVSTDAGGIKHIIKNGINGEVIPNRDPKLFSEKILKYIHKNNHKMCQYSVRKYSNRLITKRYIQIYKNSKIQ